MGKDFSYVDATLNWSVEVGFNMESIIDYFDSIKSNVGDAVENGIYDYLWQFRKEALANKPWNDVTGNLRRSHKIVPTDDGWSLVVDATEDGTATWNGRPYNYAFALEHGWLSSKYKWLEPILASTEDDLVYHVEQAIESLIDAIDNEYSRTEMKSSKGKHFVMLRYPAGTIDPLSGVKIGGRFVRKL